MSLRCPDSSGSDVKSRHGAQVPSTIVNSNRVQKTLYQLFGKGFAVDVLLLAASMTSQASGLLIQADLLPTVGALPQDTSDVLPQIAAVGTLRTL